MMLLLSVGTVKRVAVGAVRAQLDWTKRAWSVGREQGAWWRTGLPERGPFQVRPNGKLWLMEPGAGALMVTLDNAPTGPSDHIHKAGEGTLTDVTNPQWPITKLRWSRDGEGAGAAAGLAPIRSRAVALCNANLPATGYQEPPNCCEKTPGRKKDAAGNTGCGGFPGWMIRELGREKFIKDEVVVGKGSKWETKVNVASDTIAWKQMALAIEKKRGWPPETLWKAYASGKRPLPGDIYVLKGYVPRMNGIGFRHVGVIVDASGSTWKTADGGQGLGYAVGFNLRPLEADSGKIKGEDQHPASVDGWVDLEALLEK
jgi:hypothetical protein